MRRLSAFVIAVLAVFILASCQRKSEVKRPPAPIEPWKIVSYDPSGGCGTYLGNGSIGVRLHAEGVGWHKGESLQCLMAGVYAGEELAPLPNFSDLPIYLGDKAAKDKRFVVDHDEPYEQTLDLKAGTLRTKCTLMQGRKTIKADILFVLSRRSDRIDIAVDATPDFNGSISSDVDATNPGKLWKETGNYLSTFHQKIYTLAAEPSEQIAITSGFSRHSDGAKDIRGKTTGLAIAFSTSPGKAIRFTKSVMVSRGRHIPGVDNLAKLMLGSDKAVDDSQRAWQDLWKSRIEIEGDKEAQRAVNACLFYLLGSVREGTDYSIPPMGISTDAWHGHVFWDADTWMFPALLPQYPELAKSIVSYRYRTLPGAKKNAQKRGLKGAEYAWESARTGLETIGKPFSEERHITSDVALAQWQYYQATQDINWLRDFGYPVISSCADYWVSRASYNPAKDRFEILRVMSPDEDSDIVDNSAYTNASTKKTLQIAAAAGMQLGKQVPAEWFKVASRMYIPFDKANGRFLEFDGFKGRQTKQADTELLIYPLDHPMDASTREKTFDYWAKMVNPKGPAMSSSVHAVIAAKLGRTDEAYRYFTESYRPFLREPFCYFNEKRSRTYENMCFLTGAAGPVQAVIYGFCGLSYDNGGKLSVSPHLPKNWKSVTLRNVYSQGRRFDIIIRRGKKPQILPL